MKKIFTLLFIVFSTIISNAQQTKVEVAVAPVDNKIVDAKTAITPIEILYLKESEFNFGKIPQGKPVTHVFELINKGKDSLKIVNVQASCGCTTPEWDRDKAIAPGGIGKITVGYNAAAEGPFTKPVTITFNGIETKQLFIKGEVWKTPVASAPENKSLGDLKN
jgi:hypothetical protein